MKLKFTFLGLFFFVLFQANDLFKTLQNKPMKNASSLVVFYRSDCPYCMKLDEEIGKNADLSDEIKSKFNVSVIDITTKEGRKIAAYYGVNRVPAIIKYDSKNEQFENIIGFQKSNVLRNLLFNNKKSIKISKNLTTTSICGNGIIESGESCDDGNMVNGDGCSNTCSVEAFCGNGIVESGETCDDGNTVNGDGCSNTCKVETAVCGNGIVENGESCDDGNMVNGDGCSNTCTVETMCGNGIVESGESCDDGNTVNGDGCSYTCKVEIAVCGNGMVESGESCDDGNMVNGDGCNNNCTVQSGWSCTGNPSVCSNTLGVDEISSQGVFNLIVAPNPVVDKLHIQFFLPKKSNVEITVIDISGKQVFQSKISNLIIGLNEIDLPFKNKLSSGTYILKMKFANEVLTKKLMVK
jgi:cysteine-rich repeat protein